MPNLNGVETYRRLRAIRPDLRAVLMSGYDESQAMASFGREDPVVFLQKPFRPASLLSSIQESLRDGS